MKKKISLLAILLLLSVGFFASSCKDDEIKVEENQFGENSNSQDSIYVESEVWDFKELGEDSNCIETEGEPVDDPEKEDEPPVGASSVSKYSYSYPEISFEYPTMKNNNGTHYWNGDLEISVIKKSLFFTIKITKADGKGFQQAGTLYLKRGRIAGTIVGKKSYKAGTKSVVFTYIPSFQTGIESIWPMVISKNGNRSYKDPIYFYTDPMYLKDWGWGNFLGTFNNIEVECNGPQNLSLTGAYQCVYYCKDYIKRMYNLSFSSTANANGWYTLKKFEPYFDRCPNGGSVPPRPGDILCLTNSSYGHVAVIAKVTDNEILIAQQNAGKNLAPIGQKLTFSRKNGKYTISGYASGYTVQGWLHYKNF